ncbi:Serum response factor-like [Papilio xuthus]|uniref:Serum response factor-like n=1 Tax=Papilio xuthus TaxID=66420 RepID=A0A194PSZ0_PAPXU|nr:Serum response factor-like [Papilio xuthus]
MDAPGGAREPRFGSPYGMGLLGDVGDMYGAGRPPSSLGGGGLRPGMQPCPVPRAGVKRPSDQCYDERPSQSLGLEHCPMPDIADDGYASLQPKKSPPSNGKKTKGRVKIKMEYIDNKLRRYTTFSKRKTGIMKKVGCRRFWQYSIHQPSGLCDHSLLCVCLPVTILRLYCKVKCGR